MTGRDFDEITDLRYHRTRWFDPGLGQWLSEDPIGFAAGDENLRRYVGNGATNATDPSGLFEPSNATADPKQLKEASNTLIAPISRMTAEDERLIVEETLREVQHWLAARELAAQAEFYQEVAKEDALLKLWYLSLMEQGLSVSEIRTIRNSGAERYLTARRQEEAVQWHATWSKASQNTARPLRLAVVARANGSTCNWDVFADAHVVDQLQGSSNRIMGAHRHDQGSRGRDAITPTADDKAAMERYDARVEALALHYWTYKEMELWEKVVLIANFVPVPGVGIAADYVVMLHPDSSWFERGMAFLSLSINIATFDVAINVIVYRPSALISEGSPS